MRKYSHLGLSGMLICCAAGLIAQTGRDAYRQAYDVWRKAHAELERDAATGGPEQVAQADRAGAAAASFEATRIAHLKSSAEEAAQRRQAIIFQTALTRPSTDLEPQAAPELVAGELQTAARTIARFADDKDRGIQQFRQALERERVALTALSDSIQASQKTVAATSAAGAALEGSRIKAAQAFGHQAAQLSPTMEQLEKESAAWSDYYEKLAHAIQVTNAPPPPVNVISAAPRTDSLPRVSLPRFVGAWTYPMVNGIFHGMQPEFVDLVIHEQGGHADGTLYGRFKPPAGSATDPVVRFDFQGDFSGTATQKFTLVTSDGARGTIELIPGPAFNLLEVNFQTAPRVNRIRAANFILVKK